MGMLQSLFSLISRVFRWPAVATPPVAVQPIRRVDAGLYVAFGFLVAGITLGFLHSGAWVFLGVGLALAIVAGTMTEIVEPDRAGYMCFGCYVGPLDPGWQFPITGIMDCCQRPGKELRLDLGKMKVFTSKKTPITAQVTVFYRLDPTDEDLRNSCLYLPKDFKEAEVMFRDSAESVVRSVLGKDDFGQLIPEQEKLEDSVKGKIKDNYKRWGFGVAGVEIRDFDEEVESGAERIKIQGLAAANVRIAEANAFRENYPLAIATGVKALADALSGWREKEKKKSPQEQSDEEEDDKPQQTDQNPIVAVAQDVAQAVRGAAGGRKKRRP